MKLVNEQPVYFGTKNRGAASPERQRAHLHVLRPEQLTEQLVYFGTKNRGAATPDSATALTACDRVRIYYGQSARGELFPC